MSATLDRARALLAEALEIGPSNIGDDASIDTEDRWDSLAHLRIIEAVESQLGHELGPDAIVGITSLRDVAAALDGSAA